MNSIRISLLTRITGALFELLTPELIREFLLGAIGSLEAAIQKSENKVDDVVLPLIAKLKAVLGE